ncbi:hypothetical protein FKW77_010265 [Venturia effusa]|uniref:Cell wall protein n=1 Tax=Venturia effusa TaxID=50376 RepID=A0A517L4I4_9PEZI|nr:hypothetical protein FKW77_010265 [Venturia effusa]
MRSTSFITAAVALFSSASAGPFHAGSMSTRSTAACQSIESHLESNNAFSDEVALLGDVKLLIENSESILNDIDTRLTRLGVDQHIARHRNSNRAELPSHDTGKLVPVAQLAEKIQNEINALTEIILDIECPRSLPMKRFRSCVAAQEKPLQRLKKLYPSSMDWDAYDHDGARKGPPTNAPNVPRDNTPTGRGRKDHPAPGNVRPRVRPHLHPHDHPHVLVHSHPHGESHGHPSLTTTTVLLPTSTLFQSTTTVTVTVPASTNSTTTCTSTVFASSLTTITTDASPSTTDMLSDYTTSAAISSSPSSSAFVGNSSSAVTSGSSSASASVTVAQSTSLSTMNTTSLYITLATVTINPNQTATFTKTTETTLPITSTTELDVIQTVDATFTSDGTSVMNASTVTVYQTSGSASSSSLNTSSTSLSTSTSTLNSPSTTTVYQTSGSTSSVSYHVSPTVSSNDSSTSTDTSYRTIWMSTSISPYLYAVRTSGIPSGPTNSSSGDAQGLSAYSTVTSTSYSTAQSATSSAA